MNYLQCLFQLQVLRWFCSKHLVELWTFPMFWVSSQILVWTTDWRMLVSKIIPFVNKIISILMYSFNTCAVLSFVSILKNSRSRVPFYIESFKRLETVWRSETFYQQSGGKVQQVTTWVPMFLTFMGKMLVPLGWWAPSCLTPVRSPLRGDIPNKYPLYKVYMGLIIKGPPSQGYQHFPYETSIVIFELPNWSGLRWTKILLTGHIWIPLTGHIWVIPDGFFCTICWGITHTIYVWYIYLHLPTKINQM